MEEFLKRIKVALICTALTVKCIVTIIAHWLKVILVVGIIKVADITHSIKLMMFAKKVYIFFGFK